MKPAPSARIWVMEGREGKKWVPILFRHTRSEARRHSRDWKRAYYESYRIVAYVRVVARRAHG